MHYPKKMEKEVGDNDRIRYFDGKLDEINIFVKRIPIKRGDLKDNVECANTEFSRLERVVKLFPFKSNEKFSYFAFEKMITDLATYIKEQNKKIFIDEEERRKLRHHIIRYLDTENLRLGRTLWNYLTAGQHNFKEDGFEVGPITNPNFQGLDLVAAYLIKQLVSQSSLLILRISNLQGVSDRVMLGQYHRQSFDNLRSSAFGNDWILAHN
ncbi:hypothetical protein Tco_1137515 [Tanacetum coccineum]